MSRLLPFFLILVFLVALALAPQPATSAPSGKAVTREMTIGGGLLAWFLTYEPAEHS